MANLRQVVFFTEKGIKEADRVLKKDRQFIVLDFTQKGMPLAVKVKMIMGCMRS